MVVASTYHYYYIKCILGSEIGRSAVQNAPKVGHMHDSLTSSEIKKV